MNERLLKYAHLRPGTFGPTLQALRLVTLAGSVVASASCDSWLTKPALYSSVSVTATRRDGAPIPGVSLTLYTGFRPMGYATTDSAGRYVFDRIPQGQYGVFATLPSGYVGIERLLGGRPTNVVDDLIVNPDSATSVRFTFLKEGPGTLVVRVVNPDGSPIGNVPVTVYSPAATEARATTDAAGRIVFEDVPFGLHGVIINRPFFYRDYRVPNDSLYSSRDNLVVEQGSRDSVTFSIKRCSGTVHVVVRDQNGSAVRGVTAALFSSTQTFGLVVTGTSGEAFLGPAPCAIQLGVAINPPAGYSAPTGRGTSFVDGLVVSDAGSVDAVFQVQRLR